MHVYSGCVSWDKLEGVVRASVTVEACSASGGLVQPLPRVVVKVPASNPTEFLSHVLKLEDEDQTITNRFSREGEREEAGALVLGGGGASVFLFLSKAQG